MSRVSGKSDKDGTLVALGDAIRRLRAARGLTQEAFADEAEIDRSHMGKIERGERNLTVLNVKRVAAALGLSVAALFEQAGL
ncbi:MAG: helix-turn-helix transcriptional regulator [Sphingopyxis sp.]|nr:helix-turn-helix transcriptional regulator [Sphingopyxis sp.]